MKKNLILLIFSFICLFSNEEVPLFFWRSGSFQNFGDELSKALVERIVNRPVSWVNTQKGRKFLAIGSIISFAQQNDVIWGSGINGKALELARYKFTSLDVRAVRGPLTRKFLQDHFSIKCPEIYGDPALLFPYFFPEYQRQENPFIDVLIVPHYSECHLFKGDIASVRLSSSETEASSAARLGGKCLVLCATEPWEKILKHILDSKLVISTSLHGIILAEAYGIPARLLRLTENEPIFKYKDYYLGTNRPDFRFAKSVEEALEMGGERPFECDLEALYYTFPFDLYAGSSFTLPTRWRK